MSKYNLHPLGYWEEFELLCFRLWRSIWNDPNAHQYGRRGQAQHGVDVYGHSPFDESMIGIQCKGKNGDYGQQLTVKEIDEECVKAAKFTPKLGTFIMATTSPRDTELQDHCNQLNEDKTYNFKVDTWSWDDIKEEIICRPELLKDFYPSFETYSINRITFSKSISINRLEAFFSRPGLLPFEHQKVKKHLYDLTYELALNALHHGKASYFLVQVDGNRITFKDDGKYFDPRHLLQCDQNNGGSITLRYAQKYFYYNAYYENNEENIFEVDYMGNDVDSYQNDPFYLVLKIDEISSREQLSRSVSNEIKEQASGNQDVIVDLTDNRLAASTCFGIVDGLNDSLEESQSAIVYYPASLYYEKELKQRANSSHIHFIKKDSQTDKD